MAFILLSAPTGSADRDRATSSVTAAAGLVFRFSM